MTIGPYDWSKTMCIRKACERDIPQILSLYAAAREFMHQSGNPTQWPGNYPALEDVIDDMARNALFVYAQGSDVLAVFFFACGRDRTYDHIDGAWLNDEPYAVVHRVASRRGSGAGRRCLAWACDQVSNLRIDTHENNAPMRHVLLGLGFVECGTIICEDGTPRIAYQHVADGPTSSREGRRIHAQP